MARRHPARLRHGGQGQPLPHPHETPQGPRGTRRTPHERRRRLGPTLGPVLLQLPPTLRADPDRLAACLDRFPDGVRVAVEPRHPTWWTDETRHVLEQHGAALCWTDRLGRAQTPLWRTTGWLYLRFHEGSADPWPNYDDETLQTWATEIGRTDDAYAYFNNDPGGAAVRNALRFAALTDQHRPRATTG